MIDKKDIMEFHKSSLERQKQLAMNESAKKAEASKKNHEFYSKYYDSLNERAIKDNEHNDIISSARNSALSTCMKAIFVSALEANTLSDEGRALAENLVDNYISEKGGAEKIFNECADRSYLLSRLSSIVEDAAEDETKEIEKIDVDTLGEDEPEEETDDDAEEKADDEALDDATGKDEDEDIDKDLDPKEEEKSEEEGESKEEEEDKSEDDDEDEEDDEDDSDDDEESEGEENLRTAGSTDEDIEDAPEDDNIDSKLDDTKEESEDSSDDEDKDIDDKLDSGDDESESAEDEAPEEEAGSEEDDVVIDNDEDNGSKDASVNDTDEEGEQTGNKLYDELENEEDVQKAVELIRNRVADAEEAFIKRNAEDKQTMDNLLNKISDNVKTVEKLADNDSAKSKIAQENVHMAHQEIGKLHNKPQSIFEAMVRNLSSSIVKDEEVKKNYLNENGSIDMTSIIESAKIMYAFLETLNTLQFERVDGDYIKKALSEI